jgi:hypothetical protein
VNRYHSTRLLRPYHERAAAPLPGAAALTLMAEQEAAKLLLLGEEGLGFVLWDTMLEAYTIDDDGHVHLAEGALQKRLISVVSPIITKSEI